MSQGNLETIFRVELNINQMESFVKKYMELIWAIWILMANDILISENKNSKSKRTCQSIVEHPCAFHQTLEIGWI